ncbi:RNA polymerase sigma factor [Parabacteroides sp. OttesenSCG-928-G21]|nr:RNA polymerase sigma factor [Parabacteroides sp. OttesenSCG-928-G21]
MTGSAEKEVTKLIETYQPGLRSFIRKRVVNQEDAEDILQDVFYQLVKASDTLSEIEQISAWLYRVARNMIINKGKKKKESAFYSSEEEYEVLSEFSELLFNDNANSPETEYLRSLVWTELESALAELPVEQSEVFIQMELEGLPVKDISQITGVPVNTLLSRKYYAVQHLRKRLKDLYVDLVENN